MSHSIGASRRVLTKIMTSLKMTNTYEQEWYDNYYVRIPNRVIRYKEEYAKSLYQHPPDEILRMIRLPPYNNWDEACESIPVETIGVWCSGGADSTILLYNLARTVLDKGLPYKIQPMSVRRSPRNWNWIYAANIIEHIQDRLNVEFLPHETYWPAIEDEHQTNIQEFLDKDHENFSKNKIQVLFSGITKNPPRSEMEKNPKWIEGLTEDTRNDEADRPTMMATPMRTYINPWFQEDKRFIAKMYEELGCMDLFRMTRSCEGHIDDTKNYTVGCGKCWWCYEREWAFGEY